MADAMLARMTRTSGQDDEADVLLGEAADWLVRLVSGEATQDDADALARWRATSPAHEAAFREVAGVRDYAAVARSTRAPMSRRAVLAGGGGMAVALLGAVGMTRPPLGLWPSFAELMADHRTPVGGRYAFSPHDGVKVELSSRTSVSLSGGGTGISLVGGEAFVTAVSRDRPFRVEAAGLRATATEAQLSIRSLSNRVQLTCVAGMIDCDVQGQQFALARDDAVTLTPDGAVRRSRVNAMQEAAWRRGLLIFEGAPLVQVVDQINLYRSGRVILANSQIASLPVNAVFHINQIHNAVAQLESLLRLHARPVAADVVLLG